MTLFHHLANFHSARWPFSIWSFGAISLGYWAIAFIISRPIFRSMPALDMGMPVARAIRCFSFVMPSARFHEKERPGMGVASKQTIPPVVYNYLP